MSSKTCSLGPLPIITTPEDVLTVATRLNYSMGNWDCGHGRVDTCRYLDSWWMVEVALVRPTLTLIALCTQSREIEVVRAFVFLIFLPYRFRRRLDLQAPDLWLQDILGFLQMPLCHMPNQAQRSKALCTIQGRAFLRGGSRNAPS